MFRVVVFGGYSMGKWDDTVNAYYEVGIKETDRAKPVPMDPEDMPKADKDGWSEFRICT